MGREIGAPPRVLKDMDIVLTIQGMVEVRLRETTLVLGTECARAMARALLFAADAWKGKDT